MKVLQPTAQQYEQYKSVLPFVKDSQGRNILGFGVLEDPNYSEYYSIIQTFKTIEL